MATPSAETSPYLAKLRDPRWQKKRLEIMSRDGFACVSCEDATHTLHVHHVRYLRDRDPWDYPDHLLVTLCDWCHAQEHEEENAAYHAAEHPEFSRAILEHGGFPLAMTIAVHLDCQLPRGLRLTRDEWKIIADDFKRSVRGIAASHGYQFTLPKITRAKAEADEGDAR